MQLLIWQSERWESVGAEALFFTFRISDIKSTFFKWNLTQDTNTTQVNAIQFNCVYMHAREWSCTQDKDHVVPVRVWWIMETQKYPACTLISYGWVARLCCRWLSLGGESDPNFPWEKFPLGQQSIQNTTTKINYNTIQCNTIHTLKR